MPDSTGPISVQPVAGRIGAEIAGVDIAEPLDQETVAVIQDALDTWKVVFFRGQHLDHAAQIAFGRQFGELTYAHPHDDAPPESHPEIYTVDSRRFQQRYGIDADQQVRRKYSYTSGWHSDVTPAINPPAGSILRADIIPSYGGDTTFTNLAAAYEGLSGAGPGVRGHAAGGAPVRGQLVRPAPAALRLHRAHRAERPGRAPPGGARAPPHAGSGACSSTRCSPTTCSTCRRWRAAGSSAICSTS